MTVPGKHIKTITFPTFDQLNEALHAADVLALGFHADNRWVVDDGTTTMLYRLDLVDDAPHPEPQPELPALVVSIRDAADQLGVSEKTVRRLISNGELPARKVGSQYRILTKTLETFKQSRD